MLLNNSIGVFLAEFHVFAQRNVALSWLSFEKTTWKRKGFYKNQIYFCDGYLPWNPMTTWAVYYTYDFIYQMNTYMIYFFFHYFSFSVMFILRRESFTLPYHSRYQKNSVKIKRGFRGFSWLITCGCVACVQNNTTKGRLSFLQLFLKLLPLVK